MATAETKPVVTASAPTAPAAAPKVVVKPKAKAKAKAKPAVKKAAAKTSAATTKAVVAKPATPVKEKKVKMVRDSFTMPKPEYAVLDVLKLRAAKLSMPIKKTELIRAGIKALAALPDAVFLATLRAVPNLKTGRPAKN